MFYFCQYRLLFWQLSFSALFPLSTDSNVPPPIRPISSGVGFDDPIFRGHRVAAGTRRPQTVEGSAPTTRHLHEPLLSCEPRFIMGQELTGLGLLAPASVEGLLSASNRLGLGLMTSTSDTMGFLHDNRIRITQTTMSRDTLLSSSNRMGLVASPGCASRLLESRVNGMGLLATPGTSCYSRMKVSENVPSPPSAPDIVTQNRRSAETHFSNKGWSSKLF